MYGAGTIVAGKYRIEHVLGEGGMGVVVAATHIHLGTAVALKFLRHDMTKNASVVERFMREARASAQLRGDNVCRVSDVGTAENGCPFIVMELLTGQDIATAMSQHGAMPLANAIEIIMQACLAIGEAHALGIVHRDLKPGNLFWTERPDGTPCIKVLDFGVAKAPEVNFSLTQTSNVIGSPGYMSPEQLKSSKSVDGRSDIWSLGVVLYEMVSGRKPFVGESMTELALRVSLDPMPPLTGVVPDAFEAILIRCLEKESAKRFNDVAELAAALAPFLGARGTELAYGVARVLRGAQQVLPQPPAIQQTPTTLRGATGSISGIRNARSWKLPAAIGFGAAMGVGIAIVMVGHQRNASMSPAETRKLEPETKTMSMQPALPSANASTEPGKMESAKTEAAKTEAAKTEAAKTEAAKTEAAKTEAAKTEPAKTGSAKTEPAKTGSAKTESAKTESAKTELAKSDAERTKTAAKTAAKTEPEKKHHSKAPTTSKTATSTSDKAATPKPTTPTSPGDVGDSRF